MKINASYLFLFVSLFLVHPACRSQDSVGDRAPAVAGQFYPADAADLQRMLTTLYAHATPSLPLGTVLAIISPHAGYVYSGEVAASSYNQIDSNASYNTIFILGPSHYVGFEGAAVWPGGAFITPLGSVKVNAEVARRLIAASDRFSARLDAHQREHSIEVQIPFLQRRLRHPFSIVPIVLGECTPETCVKIAAVLRPYLTQENLFVISTDFSHYPSSSDAPAVDSASERAILSNSAGSLLRALRDNEEKGVPGLVTSMCGWPCVLTLLDMTAGDAGLTYTPIRYRNSGDVTGGGTSVVGYWSITLSRKDKAESALSNEDKRRLLALARRTIEEYVRTNGTPAIDTEGFSDAMKAPRGAFVTLNEKGALRGCIGRFDASEPLYRVVQEMAIAAATQDYRFPAVEPGEVDDLAIEISVLTPMRRIKSIDEIQLGKHGITIRKGGRSGTFLPQVARETGWTKEEFLGHCAQDKAGIGWDGWKDAEIYTYEALVFSEGNLSGS